MQVKRQLQTKNPLGNIQQKPSGEHPLPLIRQSVDKCDIGEKEVNNLYLFYFIYLIKIQTTLNFSRQSNETEVSLNRIQDFLE